MHAVEFQASIEDGIIKVPPQYQDIAKNHLVKLIMMYDDNTDELEFKKNKATIEKQVEDYRTGHANILSEDDYNEKMTRFMRDLKSKYESS